MNIPQFIRNLWSRMDTDINADELLEIDGVFDLLFDLNKPVQLNFTVGMLECNSSKDIKHIEKMRGLSFKVRKSENQFLFKYKGKAYLQDIIHFEPNKLKYNG